MVRPILQSRLLVGISQQGSKVFSRSDSLYNETYSVFCS